MDYDEAMDEATIVSEAEARRELRLHGVRDEADVTEALGVARLRSGELSSARLLGWLGY